MRYYGGKSKLLDFLSEGITKTGINHGSIFCDLFSRATGIVNFKGR